MTFKNNNNGIGIAITNMPGHTKPALAIVRGENLIYVGSFKNAMKAMQFEEAMRELLEIKK